MESSGEGRNGAEDLGSGRVQPNPDSTVTTTYAVDRWVHETPSSSSSDRSWSGTSIGTHRHPLNGPGVSHRHKHGSPQAPMSRGRDTGNGATS